MPTLSIAGFRPNEQPRGVEADLDAGADLADARGRFADVGIEARLQQMERR
jgi:hypothetical protein